MIYFEIDTASEGHRETRFSGMEVADPKHGRQLRAVNIDFLIREAKQRVREGLERRTIVHVVLDRDAAEDIVDCGIDCATAGGAGEVIFPEMN